MESGAKQAAENVVQKRSIIAAIMVLLSSVGSACAGLDPWLLGALIVANGGPYIGATINSATNMGNLYHNDCNDRGIHTVHQPLQNVDHESANAYRKVDELDKNDHEPRRELKIVHDNATKWVAVSPDNMGLLSEADIDRLIKEYQDASPDAACNRLAVAMCGKLSNSIAKYFISEKILYVLSWRGRVKRMNIETRASFDDITYFSEGSVDKVSAGSDRVAIAKELNCYEAIANMHGELAVHEISTGKLIRCARYNQPPARIALSPNGKKLAALHWLKRYLYILDVDDKSKDIELRWAKNDEKLNWWDSIDTLTFSPDSTCILNVSDYKNEALIMSAEDGSTLFKFTTDDRPRKGLFSPDGLTALVQYWNHQMETKIAFAKRVGKDDDNNKNN